MTTPNIDSIGEKALEQLLANVFDAAWYTLRYPDVRSSGLEPIRHYIKHGMLEGRDPNRWFDGAWYVEHYPDVAAAGHNPLLHYLVTGAVELRNPHPRFDAAWYAEEHPEAAGNPLLYHLRVGMVRGWATEKTIVIAQYLPSELSIPDPGGDPEVDIVIPVFKAFAITRRCIESVLADTHRPRGRILVVDDHGPEPDLSAWLRGLDAAGQITLLRNARNLGFVASANRGMHAAGRNDVVLLNSDTEVPPGWLRRLRAQAYGGPRIASVSPLSNNATICGYPRDGTNAIPFGRIWPEIDAACQAVNAGRAVDLPTTVGFCMYIRRAALDQAGPFDEAAFGRGYGEETDFCLRTAGMGWRHILACDVFVYHEGGVSFGHETGPLLQAAAATITRRFPDYFARVARHIRLDAVGPYRFAVTARLFAASPLPTILMISHGFGGGVGHHINALAARLAGRANVLLLSATVRGARLSVPMVPGHPVLDLPAERLEDLVRVLRSARVARVHVHHLVGMDMDIQALIHRLDVPFDTTVHDYFALCPQVNMLPWSDGLWCQEPEAATCNACIATRASHGARDILSWRVSHAWLLRDAERVFCPSADALARLTRFGLAERAVVAPHEPIPAGPWPHHRSRRALKKLRIALIGVLANHKGAALAASVIQAADPATHEFHLIGEIEGVFPADALARLHVNGRYEPDALPGLLARLDPHVLWFPASWPETYSYTLSEGIESGRPIVVTKIGAFPDRLGGRPMTWLTPPTTDPARWLQVFAAVRTALQSPSERTAERPRIADFYADSYLAAPAVSRFAPRPATGLRAVVVPEQSGNGALSPCAYIRLLLPLTHPACGQDIEVIVADTVSALRYKADMFVTHRYAIPDVAAAEALAAHARAIGGRLVYDLDDDLLHIPREHPEAAALRPKTQVVRRMLRLADQVLVSTPALAARVGVAATVVPNGLDEQLWTAAPAIPRPRQMPVRILCMGTATHTADFALIEPALARIAEDFGYRVSIDMIGFSDAPHLPEWVKRLPIPPSARASYPGFVHWFTGQRAWDIGLAPLVDSAFNRCKSAIKALDYAAAGIPVIASDGPVYRGSPADGVGGMLVANRPDAWYAAISRLIRDVPLRERLALGARAAFLERGTLAAQAEMRRGLWQVARGPSTNV